MPPVEETIGVSDNVRRGAFMTLHLSTRPQAAHGHQGICRAFDIALAF
jgi:hypothetical protein